MKVFLIALVVIVVGGASWYLYSTQGARAPMPMPSTENAEPGSSGTAGIKGSQDQGNLGLPAQAGQTDTGVVQRPLEDGAEGSIIGNNLALGTNSSVSLGSYLIAYNSMTLYLYTKDTGTTSTCYGQCAVNWPPYLVGPEDNLTQIKAGVTGKVDTTTRTDGTLQVTYNGHPLYFWKSDVRAGDTTGQNVGSVWFVVKP